jgi:hypothetical protein
MMGSILLFFAVRAQKNPLWWAVAPAILLPCVEPGFNVEDVSNHIVKEPSSSRYLEALPAGSAPAGTAGAPAI